MAESLRRLSNNETCRILQEKLERWYKDYHESYEKERQLKELTNSRNHEIQQLERELNATHLQLSLVQQE
ncbi:UNVERIFIED_CONTAM: hypothetical protein K2H54_056273 [Gekko kuhli]